MPEVGIHERVSFNLLRGAGDVDRRGEQLALAVPEEEYLPPLVLGPFDAAEVGQIRRAIHLGMSIGIDRTPVLGHYRVAQSPAGASWFARLPGFHRRIG